MKKIAVLMDGGHVRFLAKKAGKTYDPGFIEKVGLACGTANEDIQRILYYDCAPYAGTATLPVSGNLYTFKASDQWLHELARKDLFGVRHGVLKFRGWTPKNVPIAPAPGGLTDADFAPEFEQKGVDMRIGLDMANYASNRSIELVALLTNDTDCIPAMKYVRRAGLQVALVCVPGCSPARELLSHCDYKRNIAWP
jgi:uncharacterized LabA/DUF88 family protein